MRGVAYMVLAIVFFANFMEPLVEVVECSREKIMISTALNNAFRAAKDRSLTDSSIRDLNAEVDKERFVEYFAETFADNLDLTVESKSENYINFTCHDDRFNGFRIDLNIHSDTIDSADARDKEATRVDIQLKTKYLFKTKLLKQIQETTDYTIEMETTYLLWVKN